jgi:type IV pilus assembly protein PilW
MRLNHPRRSIHRLLAAQRGLGMVELMVGITVGLIVTAGAAMVATRQITEHRRLMLEVQMQQDLRIAADLLQQDLRRAGYRGLPGNSVWEPERNGGTTPAKDAVASPYAVVTQTDPQHPTDIYYRYARPPTGSTIPNKTNTLASNEQLGIRWDQTAKVLYLQLGVTATGDPNWQPITDPDAVLIENFSAPIVSQQISLGDLCDPGCETAGNCPTQTIRRVDFTITASAKSDPSIRRTLQVSEKLRADDISGACPAAVLPTPPASP